MVSLEAEAASFLIAILSFFYASVCAIIVVIPLSAAARIRLSECGTEEAGA